MRSLIMIAVVSTTLIFTGAGLAGGQEFNVKDIDAMIDKGIEAILTLQDGDGGWTYQGVVGKPIGYRVSATCLVCYSLLKLAPKNEKAIAAAEKGIKFVMDSANKHKEMSGDGLKGYDTRFWGQTYAVWLLSYLYSQKDAKNKDEIKATMEKLISILEKTAAKGGGWNYASRESVCSFLTSTVLLNFLGAKEADFKVDEELLKKSVECLKKQKLDNGAFNYSGFGKGGTESMNAPAGSCARMPGAELALLKYKEGSEEAMEKSIEVFFENWKELKARYKQTGTHVGKYKIAPYYFFFGHYYTGLSIAALSKRDSRDKHYRKLFELFLETREKDGGWNDRVFEPSKSYSTAKVLLILMLMRDHLGA
jgi:hypothetical protein